MLFEAFRPAFTGNSVAVWPHRVCTGCLCQGKCPLLAKIGDREGQGPRVGAYGNRERAAFPAETTERRF